MPSLPHVMSPEQRKMHGSVPGRRLPGRRGTSVNMNTNEVLANIGLELRVTRKVNIST